MLVILKPRVLAWGLLLILGAGSVWAGQEKEIPLPELARKVRSRNMHPQEREKAVNRLGGVTNASDARSNQILDVLLDIVKDKDDDLMVRIACIDALGQLEANTFAADHEAKNKFLEPLTAVLVNLDERVFVRQAVTKVFTKTLDPKGLKDAKAVDAMLVLLEDKDGRQNKAKAVPVILRTECAHAIGEFGDPKTFKTLVEVLRQPDLDPVLKEATVGAMATLLEKAGDAVEVDAPTCAKLQEIASDKATPEDIRAQGIILLAHLKANGSKHRNDVIDLCKQILKVEDRLVLLEAAIEALGIVGDQDSIPVLVDTYDVFFDPKNPGDKKQVDLRIAIMHTLGYALSAQSARKPGPDAAIIGRVVKLLLQVVDVQSDKKEVPEVISAAVYALRYLYPKKKEFVDFQKPAAEKLANLMRKSHDKEDLIKGITKTLTFLTEKDYGDNIERWERYFDTAFPQK